MVRPFVKFRAHHERHCDAVECGYKIKKNALNHNICLKTGNIAIPPPETRGF
jgi:hypothetical protein